MLALVNIQAYCVNWPVFIQSQNKFHHETLSVIEAEIGIKQHSPLDFKCFGLFLEGIWAFAAMEEVILLKHMIHLWIAFQTPLNVFSHLTP